MRTDGSSGLLASLICPNDLGLVIFTRNAPTDWGPRKLEITPGEVTLRRINGANRAVTLAINIKEINDIQYEHMRMLNPVKESRSFEAAPGEGIQAIYGNYTGGTRHGA